MHIYAMLTIGPATKAFLEEVAPPTAGLKKFSAY